MPASAADALGGPDESLVSPGDVSGNGLPKSFMPGPITVDRLTEIVAKLGCTNSSSSRLLLPMAVRLYKCVVGGLGSSLARV